MNPGHESKKCIHCGEVFYRGFRADRGGHVSGGEGGGSMTAARRAQKSVNIPLSVRGENLPMSTNMECEAHPGQPELQILWDEYSDAIEIAQRSGVPQDWLTAGRLYLTYAKARNEQESAL